MSELAYDDKKSVCRVSFQDKDYTYYLLSTLKDLERHYCMMMMEASNDWLYQIYRDLLLDVSHLERRVYTVLFLNGWYLLEGVQEKYHLFFENYQKLTMKGQF